MVEKEKKITSTTQNIITFDTRDKTFIDPNTVTLGKISLEKFLETPSNPLQLEHEILSRADTSRLLKKRSMCRKRRSACRGPSTSDIRNTQLQEHKKDRHEFEVLLTALKKSNFFRYASDDELKELCKYFTPVWFKKGDPIIIQNTVGTTFYVIEQGQVDIYKLKSNSPPRMEIYSCFTELEENPMKISPVRDIQQSSYSMLGPHIQQNSQKEYSQYGTYITTLRENNFFGEISILLKCKRTATCIASSDKVKCWELQSEAFHKIGRDVKVSQFGSKLSLLRRMDLFSILPEDQLENIVKNMKLETHKPSKIIIEQGEMGSHFYIILKGKVRVMRNGKMVGIIREGSYFGELALLYPQDKRNASIIAIREVQCGVLSTECFHSSIFNTVYQRVLLNQISKYENYKQPQHKNYPSNTTKELVSKFG